MTTGGGGATTTSTTPGSGAGPASSSSSGGQGGSGAGGSVDCDSAEDCPGNDTTCQQRTCESEQCGVDFAGEGTACTESGGDICDGEGNCVANEGWVPLPSSGAPTARNAHTAVWTGDVMIVWGGRTGAGMETNSGHAYDPATNTWTTISSSGAPSARHSHDAVWTGDRMIVWGGVSGGAFQVNGGIYDPASNTWSGMAVAGAPSARIEAGTVWSGEEMIVWGGRTAGNAALGTGARYNVSTNTWAAMSNSNAPLPRLRHCAAWVNGNGTHKRYIAWGGFNLSDWFDHGGEYNPANNSWQATAEVGNPPKFRESMACTEIGKILFIWGGWDGGNYFNDGRLYDHAAPTQSWYFMKQENVPDKRSNTVTLYLGGNNRFFVWGGCGGSACSTIFADGGQYVHGPNGGLWQYIPESEHLSAREDHTAVWTDEQVIIWGGREGTTVLGDGARITLEAFDPP